MFQKLRLRLVLANVVVSGLIVMAMAVAAWLMISGNVLTQSQKMLELISGNIAMQFQSGASKVEFPSKPIGGIYPHFVVRARADVSIVQSTMKTELNDAQWLPVVCMLLAWEAEKKQGLKTGADDFKQIKAARKLEIVSIGGRPFRTASVGDPDGTPYFVFLDISTEQSLLSRIAFSLGLCVLAGLALAFTGSLILANRSIRPVRLSWQRQREFTGDASHELRTPLAVISGSVEALLAHPQSTVEEKRPFIEGIGEETRRMSRLVNDLLLLARSDSDTVVFNRDAVNIASIATDAVNAMRPGAERRRIGCSLEIRAAPLVRGDAERLRQVLTILLDNAIKYTPEGGSVHAAVRYEARRAYVDVSDNGIGIAEEHIPAIFERFYRVDKARNREAGGQGLGLSIAKWIVERHGGAISVVSEPGKGSTFTIMLPEA